MIRVSYSSDLAALSTISSAEGGQLETESVADGCDNDFGLCLSFAFFGPFQFKIVELKVSSDQARTCLSGARAPRMVQGQGE